MKDMKPDILKYYPNTHTCSQEVTQQIRGAYKELIRKSVHRLKKNHTNYLFTNQGRRDMMIDVTVGCTKGCSTCFSVGSPGVIEKRLLTRLVKYIEKYLLSGVFLGGEPTHCLDLLLEVASGISDVHFVIVTNGEYLTRGNVDAIHRAGNFYITVSLDGVRVVFENVRFHILHSSL